MTEEDKDGEDASDLLDATELCLLRGSLGYPYGAEASLGGAIPDVELPATPAVVPMVLPLVLPVAELVLGFAFLERLEEDRWRRD